MKPPILSDEIRTKLWARHLCSGKYHDDGELQCGAVLPPIDFLHDDWNDLINKIAVHDNYLIQQAKAEVADEVVKWIEDNCIGVDVPTTDPEDYIGIRSMDWQSFKESLKSKYGGKK